MKKLTIFLVLMVMVTLPMMAERVTPETARKVAATFLSNNGAKAAQLTNLSKAAGFLNLYIFSTKESFVVMAADDCVKPILGYSLTNEFVVDEIPENLVWWLNNYNSQIQNAIEHKTKATEKAAKQWKELAAGNPDIAKATTIVSPLLASSWNQGAPFNNKCPIKDGNRAVTGCVATAMAQIMYYHQWPNQGIGSHSYIHNTYGEQSVNFSETTYDWTNMIDYYGNGYTTVQANAVATLLYHCGVSVNMEYGPTSSGAFSNDIPNALINYFNYSTSIRYVHRYESDEEWIALLKSELDAGRPMEYSGSGSGSHSFVCDGYDSEDFFHFNWGWANAYDSDGFYSIDNLTPPINQNYTNSQSAIIGIKPSSCSIDAPTNFTAQLIEETYDVLLEWDTQSEAIAYCIFRNGTMIDSIAPGATPQTSYTDESIPYGTFVYHIRGVDSNHEMSLSSEYKTISTQFEAPTNFTASYSNGKVYFSWSPSIGAVTYNIYCNSVQIASDVNSNTYEYTPISGSLTYFVKSVDNRGVESDASNTETLSIPFKTPIVHDLCVSSISNQNTTLSWNAPEWCYPQTSLGILSYGNGNIYYYVNFIYYGHRFLPEDLTSYANKSIYKISTNIQSTGTYTVYVYTNTIDGCPDPDSLQDVRILKCDNAGGWTDIPLSKPILITGDTDLWIVMKQEDTQGSAPIPTFNLPSYNANACYYSYSSPTNLQPFSDNYKLCWFIKAYFTNNTYTYNLYDGTNPIASNIADTCYSIENIRGNALHQYTVKTNFNGSETAPSNKASIAMGTYALSDLNLENDRMFVSENSTLTVTDDLTCTNPDHLILENGAQLINDSEGVQATVKKAIQPYTEGKRDGWNLIASPVVESLDAEDLSGLLQNEYDLYAFNASGTDDQGNAREWRNYKAQSFNINNKVGYLYANSSETTLSFVGTLVSNTGATELAWDEDAYFAGFNLIGNPYPCNAYLDRSFYVLEYDIVNNSTKFVLGENPIAPCAAVLVQTQADEDVATFSKTAPSTSSKIAVRLNQADQKGATAIDQVRIMFQQQSQLAKYPQESSASTIYIPQNGKKLVVANAEGLTELPINLRTAKNGTYTLSIETEKLDLNYLHLIDNITGEDVDLLSTSSYTFNADVNDHEWRFRLVFSNCEDAVGDNEVFAYVSNGEIVVNQEGALQIVDMTGRIIVSHSGHIQCVPTTRMMSGVYVLRLINGDNVKTQKIVIE